MRFLIDKSTGFSVGEPVSNFAELNNKVSAGVKCLTLKGIIDINSNYELPPDIHLVIPNGTGFNVESGATLTVNCSFDAGLYQIFYGDGDLSGNPKIEAAYPEWFGAKGDGVADDTNAIQKTVSWFPVIYFRPVKYRITKTISADRIHLYGNMSSYHGDLYTTFVFDGSNGPALFIGSDESLLHEPSLLSSIAFTSTNRVDVLVKIKYENRCTVSRCLFRYAGVGLYIDGDGADASWFYVEQCIFRNLDIGIEAHAGGVVIAGEFTSCGKGVYVSKGLGQMRVMGVKFDVCDIGIHCYGYLGVYVANCFERCLVAYKIDHDDIVDFSGRRNIILGGYAIGSGSGEVGIEIASGCKWNNVIGFSTGNLGSSGSDIIDNGDSNIVIVNDRFITGRYNYVIDRFFTKKITIENVDLYPFIDFKLSDSYNWRLRSLSNYFQIYNLVSGNGFMLKDSGDFELPVAGSGIILTSPSGNKFRVVVDDSGNISTESVS